MYVPPRRHVADGPAGGFAPPVAHPRNACRGSVSPVARRGPGGQSVDRASKPPVWRKRRHDYRACQVPKVVDWPKAGSPPWPSGWSRDAGWGPLLRRRPEPELTAVGACHDHARGTDGDHPVWAVVPIPIDQFRHVAGLTDRDEPRVVGDCLKP